MPEELSEIVSGYGEKSYQSRGDSPEIIEAVIEPLTPIRQSDQMDEASD